VHSIGGVFPAPVGPSSPKISPWWTSNDTSSTATIAPYVLRTPETWMTGGMMVVCKILDSGKRTKCLYHGPELSPEYSHTSMAAHEFHKSKGMILPAERAGAREFGRKI